MAALDRPRVEYRTPVDLVAEVQAGLIRIPAFQRGFRWEAGDIVKLFDSVVSGYPIGNLLLWRRPADAQQVRVGALVIDAPATDSALWVVDGQQRITSIVSALVAAATAADSRFRVHLDLETGEFHTVGARQTTPAPWLPVSLLLDTATLLGWMRDNGAWLSTEHIATADGAAKAIREYQIPTYVVTSSDEGSLVDIFSRMNTTGKPLTKTEVFQALHAGMSSDEPTDLRSLGRTTAEMGFGSIDERLALRCILAFRGGDIFREDFHAEFTSADDRRATFREVSAALRDTIEFLQREAAIHHVKLLPYSHVVPVLVRFAHLYGAPEGRAATLLRRWVWRSAVAGPLGSGNNVLVVRREMSMVDGDSSMAAAHRLAVSVEQHPDFRPELDKIHFSHAMAKLNVLGLLSALPLDLANSQPFDIAGLLEKGSPLRALVNDPSLPLVDSVANRIIAPSGTGRTLRQALLAAQPFVADSQLVDPVSVRLLAENEFEAFLRRRASAVEQTVREYIRRMADWGARDGRAVSDIMRAA